MLVIMMSRRAYRAELSGGSSYSGHIMEGDTAMRNGNKLTLMTEKQRVATEDVRRVAELANLELTAEEELRMQQDLNAILDHVAQLNELDTASVRPMAQVSEVLGSRGFLREDAVVPSLDRRQVMACAPESDGVFFKVPKVIER
jgi:aspartyl-tRNA(Asn)/glutamyl-tRNA(Gln) amidotransferase subunit C